MMTMGLRHALLGFACGGMLLSASENLLYNGDFQHGLEGFHSVETMQPPGRTDQVMDISKTAAGKSRLRMAFSRKTARYGVIVQSLNLDQVKAAGHVALRCRLRIRPQGGEDFSGSVFLRLRQRKGEKVKNRCGIWLPFSREKGLQGQLSRSLENSALVTESPLKGHWHELMGTDMLDEATDSVDVMLSGGVEKGAVTVDVMDLSLAEVEEPVCQLLKRPLSVTRGQAELPLTLQVSRSVKVTCTLRQNGRKVLRLRQRLEPGERVLYVPLKRLVPGDFKVELKAGDWHESLKLQLEEDPFAE